MRLRRQTAAADRGGGASAANEEAGAMAPAWNNVMSDRTATAQRRRATRPRVTWTPSDTTAENGSGGYWGGTIVHRWRIGQ